MIGSKCRQNFHKECEAAINKLINMELYASNCYLALAAYFGGGDVALHGFAKFFAHCSEDDAVHAQKLIKYQNLRGGRVKLQAVDRPAHDHWDTALAAVEYALGLEKQVNESLLDMHKLATSHADPHLTNYLEDKFLDEQMEAIYNLATYVTNLRRVGEGLGVFIFDKEVQ